MCCNVLDMKNYDVILITRTFGIMFFVEKKEKIETDFIA